MIGNNYANIMFIGRTKAGKSSFINYLIGKDVCKTGAGQPITPGFETYKYDNVDGVPLRIFDSKGLEVSDYASICDDMIRYIKKHCDDTDVRNWIHAIFYCTNLKSNRLEPEEINLLKKISSEISQSVHIILTHCSRKDETSIADADKMERHIRDSLRDSNIHIYRVNSVPTNTRKLSEDVFGREEILDEIFTLLWSDVAHKFAAEYSSKLYYQIKNIIQDIEDGIHSFVKREIHPFSLLKAAIKDDLDALERKMDRCLEEIDQKIDNTTEQMNTKLGKNIQPVIQFISDYSSSMGYELETCDVTDFIPYDIEYIDFDSVLENSKLGEIMELDFDSDDFFKVVKNMLKAVGALINIQDLFLEAMDDAFNEMYDAMPSCKNIEERIYDRLMDVVCVN